MAAATDRQQDILRGMQRHGIALTTQNYAVWTAYHGGGDARLRRVIDIMLGNGRTLDERALHDLYTRYCAPVAETAQFRGIAERTLVTLQLVSGLLGDMQGAAEGYGARLRSASADLDGQTDPLRPLVERLAADTHDMITHSEQLTQRLTESSQRIDELELFLSEARREASTDPLTALANRRAFDAALRQAAGEAMNSEQPLCVLIADVDHFKSVNDRWGHDAGDAVLRQVAAAMVETVRGRDTVARYGGEEFAVVLPETGLSGAAAVAEHLRVAVAACRFLPDESSAVLTVTISMGVACYEPGERLGDLVTRADAALYRAKQEGRNRTALAGAHASVVASS
jgi:diguanylate cyclase